MTTSISQPPDLSTPPSDALVGGGSGASVTGVSAAGAGGSADRAAPSAQPPRADVAEAAHILVQAHGIRTPEEVYSWPEFGTDWLSVRAPRVRTINTEYYESFLPRLAALRNVRRSEALHDVVHAAASAEEGALISLAAHSNGGVLALQVARQLIAAGIPVWRLVLIAPALRTRSTTREIADWIESGMLDSALLVQPGRDGVIGLVALSWRTRLLAWPWGALGVDGWHPAEIPSPDAGERMLSIELPDMRHSDPVAPGNRVDLYRRIISPAIGLLPWSTVTPQPMEAAAA